MAFVLTGLLWSAAAPAAGPTTPATVIERVLPTRPPVHPLGPQTGAVTIGFTIAADGSVADATVLQATGAQEFRRAALDAVKQWRFRPALLDGVPVAQPGNEVRIDFAKDEVRDHESLRGATVAPAALGSAVVDTLGSAIDKQGAGDHAGALGLLDAALATADLGPTDRAQLELSRAISLQALGRPAEALLPLRRATADGAPLIDAANRAMALRFRVQLEGQQGHAADAVEAYQHLVGVAGPLPPEDPAADVVAQLTRALAQPAPLAIPAMLLAERPGAEAAWTHTLSRRKVGFESLSGDVRRFTVACAAKSQADTVDTARTWSLPAAWGRCVITVTGAPGATFSLVEYPDP